MSKKKNKNIYITKLLLIYIIIQPILDALSGINNNVCFFYFKINLIIRGLFIMFSILYLLFKCNTKYKKYNIIYLIILFIYTIFYIISIYLFKDGNLIFEEIKKIILLFYFPISLITLFNLFDDYNIKVNDKYVIISLLIYLGLIIGANILGISFDTYKNDGVGKLGFFNSANSISAILSILLPYAVIYYKNNLKKLILFLIIYIFCILSIGTKTLILTLLIVILVNIFYYISKIIKKRDYKKISLIAIMSLVSIGSFIIILPKTPVYENIHRRIEFLNIKDTNDLIKNFDALVLGRRIKYLKDVNNFSKDINIYQRLIGIGYYNVGIKNIEMDLFDILYCNGLIGFIIFFIPLIIILKLNLPKIKENNFNNLNKKCSLVITLLTSLITGHVLVEPNVSFYVALLINKYKENREI